MSTYMRRILVPKDHLPAVTNYIREHFTSRFMVDSIKIGDADYGIVKAISSTPLVAWVPATAIATNIGDVPSAGTMLLAMQHFYASDLDLKATITEDTATTDFDSHGWTTFTYTVTDAEGSVSTLDVPILVVDDVAPVITLTATTADITVAAAATFNETTNVASATDIGDGNIKNNVIYTFHKFDGDVAGDSLDLAGAKTWLGTEGHKVRVTYNVSDAALNAATTVHCVYTAIA